MALNGITSDRMIKTFKAMECDACNLPADVFYLRDLTAKNYSILWTSSAKRPAMRLETRKPEDVLKSF